MTIGILVSLLKSAKGISTPFNTPKRPDDFIGGGNSSKLTFKLDENMKIVTNKEGIKGGARLWQLDENLFIKSKIPALR